MTDSNRTIFEIPMAEEFFTVGGLTAQTGQPADRFPYVIIKELIDNGLDAAEYAGVAPEIDVHVTHGRGLTTIRISDNGGGIDPETVTRMLNFKTRTSDKSAYRTPTRGQQGNAVKTIFGMPHALGLDEPVIIESKGVRHSLRCWLDPAGVVRVEHDQTPIEMAENSVLVSIPYSTVDGLHWVRSYALFNPHVTFSVKIDEIENGSEQAESIETVFDETYRNTNSEFQKFGPGDLASAHWYREQDFRRLVYLHISAGGSDMLLRDFVRQFRGLAGTAKAKSVCSRFDQKRLSQFDDADDDIKRLLESLKSESQTPKPAILGVIGADHFHDRLDELYSVEKFQYRKRAIEIDGVPYIVELAIAKTKSRGFIHAGVNFAKSFGDPIPEIFDCGQFQSYGLRGLKNNLNNDDQLAIAFHLVSPSLSFQDRGKTRLFLGNNLRSEVGSMIWDCSKDFYNEKKRHDRNEKSAIRAEENRAERNKESQGSLKEIVFNVLPEAIQTATGGIYRRNLYYAVRKLIQAHTEKKLGGEYFSQNLLTKYQKEFGKIDLLYYDPRGMLYEPHTGVEVRLGTREVADYQFPSWRYDKILYIEKRGFWPFLKATGLAEQFDMAVVCGEGYANEAIRILFAAAQRDKAYRLFVLHDADPAGYNICRTLAEETERMPDHRIDIIDMGLHLEDAVGMGLQSETFTRSISLPKKLVLNDFEKEWFEGEKIGKKIWKCKRIELNAMASDEFLAFIHSKMAQHGATAKVIPDDQSLTGLANELTRKMMNEKVRNELDSLLDVSGTADDLHQHFVWSTNYRLGIETAFASDRLQSWDAALRGGYYEHLNSFRAGIRATVKLAVIRQLERL